MAIIADGLRAHSSTKITTSPLSNIQFLTRSFGTVIFLKLNVNFWLVAISAVVSTVATNGAPCSYKVPNVSDIIFDVPLATEFVEEDAVNESSDKTREKRNIVDVFQSLRIHLYYDEASINKLTTEMQLFINTSLLPEAVNYWQFALAVRPASASVLLSRKCISNLYYMHVQEKRQLCVLGCKERTSCGEVIIPDEHLYQCRYCTSPNSANCGVTGPPDGVGVPNTDFLLYVSAVLSERCQNMDTVAYAAHCQQEVEQDRPIAGHVNLCPNALSTAAHDREVLMSTVKHEILHALGFSAGLYAFFRDKNGNPRTRRNRYNKPVSLNRERGYYDWDLNTIRAVTRYDWWTAEGTVEHTVNVMVTPRVQEEARKHFDCESLEGAEVENQGGDGTAFTHWEKRLFENEAMTGTHTQNPVYSRLTFALLEDSGWYKPNYSAAEELNWGHHLGCDFVMKSCGEWIRSRRAKDISPAPFCDEIKHDGKRSLATTRCTAQRDSLALCNLIPYRQPLPVEYRNFAVLDEVQDGRAIYYGGSVELADYCPYNQEFEWKAPNSTERRDSRCELDGNFAPNQVNPILEVYGDKSKCFDLANLWTERKCGRVRTFLQYKAGCYQYECTEGRLNIAVFNESWFYPCFFPGQYIHIRKVINGWLREGLIVCPPCEEVCHSEHFSSNIQVDYCQEISRDKIPQYVGDAPLDEPCAAPIVYCDFISLFLFTSLTKFFRNFILAV